MCARAFWRAFAAAFFACLFYLVIPGVFAQEEPVPGGDPLTESPGQTSDAITAAERSIPLGDDRPAAPSNPASVRNILRVLLTLALVAAAIYGAVFFIKRAAKGKAQTDPFLKILASAPLGINRNAYIISIGTRAWLVGAAENGVNLIAEINDKEILDAMLLEESQKSARNPSGPLPDFRALLGRLGMKVSTGGPGPENIRKRSERLMKMRKEQ